MLEHQFQPLGRHPNMFFLQTNWIALCIPTEIFEFYDTRLIEDIHIETWIACNVELSSKTKVDNCIASVYKTINAEYAVTYLMT